APGPRDIRGGGAEGCPEGAPGRPGGRRRSRATLLTRPHRAGSAILQRGPMKSEIHPNYVTATVRCTCGNEFLTRSTKPEIRVEICSVCHPFYTGKQKLVDSGGRVERFQRKLARRQRGRASA